MSRVRPQRHPIDPDQVQPHLKERIYGAFSCLTSLLVLSQHVGSQGDGRAEAGAALANVLLTVLSLWAASLFAEFLAHLVSHETRVTRHEWAHMVTSTWQIVAAGIPSAVLLAAAALGWPDYPVALWLSIASVVLSLGVFALLAVGRTRLTWLQKLSMVLVLVAIGVGVVGLKLLVH